MVFLARHGYGHTIPPHRVNYRANLWALARRAARRHRLGRLGRRHPRRPGAGHARRSRTRSSTTPGAAQVTFFEGGDSPVVHIDFTEPYDAGAARSACSPRPAPRGEPVRRRRRLCRDAGAAAGDGGRDRPPGARRRRHRRHDRHAGSRRWRANSGCPTRRSAWSPTAPPGAATARDAISFDEIEAVLQRVDGARARSIIEHLVRATRHDPRRPAHGRSAPAAARRAR